ncbi:kinase-like domain-containing protein [Mycena haematopus]|nr:kinase-like domain-containing protein [Mycena haematopus]
MPALRTQVTRLTDISSGQSRSSAVERPENAFILFRHKAHADNAAHHHPDLSETISRYWKGLPAEERAKWEALAQEKQREHEALHPGYVYRPRTVRRGPSTLPSRTPSPANPDVLASPESSLGRTQVDTFLDNQEQRASILKELEVIRFHIHHWSVLTCTPAPSLNYGGALAACEQRICDSLLTVLLSREAKCEALLLEGAHAQSFLGVLDRGSLPTAEYASQARRLIIRLSEVREQLSSSLFISGVSDPDEYPTFCGGFGDVYRASFSSSTVALKRIRTFHASAGAPRKRLQFCREALIWQKLRHKYILPLIGIDRETFPSFSMVSPWMKHGNILKYLSQYGRHDVEKMLLQIAEGLGYLHSMEIVHGDLRGTNILVSDDWNVCLAGFGLAGVVGDDASTTFTAHTSSANPAGSLRWFAPELILPRQFGCERFVRTPATDVYAFACVCLELHTGSPPFAAVSPDAAAMLAVIAGERPARSAGMSDHLWGLVTAAWAQEYVDRPDVKEIAEYLQTPSLTMLHAGAPERHSQRQLESEAAPIPIFRPYASGSIPYATEMDLATGLPDLD